MCFISDSFYCCVFKFINFSFGLSNLLIQSSNFFSDINIYKFNFSLFISSISSMWSHFPLLYWTNRVYSNFKVFLYWFYHLCYFWVCFCWLILLIVSCFVYSIIYYWIQDIGDFMLLSAGIFLHFSFKYFCNLFWDNKVTQKQFIFFIIFFETV